MLENETQNKLAVILELTNFIFTKIKDIFIAGCNARFKNIIN